MTEKDRLLRSLRRETVDRPPWICPGGMMNFATQDMMDEADACWPEAHTSPELMARLAAAACGTGCFENIGLPFCMTVEAEGMGAAVDMGSRGCEPHVVDYPIGSVAEWRMLREFKGEAGRAKVVLSAIRILKQRESRVPIIGNLTGPVSVAGSLLEPTVYYRELRKKKEEAHKMADCVTERIVAFGLRQLEAGADIIAVSDPAASGEILGPKLFAEYAVPYLNRVVSQLKENFPGCGIIVHICGKMHSVYKQLGDLRCDALSFDAPVNLKEAREKLPGKVIMGNVSTYALEFASAARVSELTSHCLKAGAGILAPACGLGSGAPTRNLRAALSVLKSVEELTGV